MDLGRLAADRTWEVRVAGEVDGDAQAFGLLVEREVFGLRGMRRILIDLADLAALLEAMTIKPARMCLEPGVIAILQETTWDTSCVG